jgi:hypothetical protein
LKSHIGEKQYKCPFEGCDRQFYDRGNLKYHEFRAHPNELSAHPHACIHTNCNMRFKTEKEKLEHHREKEESCVHETDNLLDLLSNFKQIFLKLEKENCEKEVDMLKENYEKTFNNALLSELISDKIGRDFNTI